MAAASFSEQLAASVFNFEMFSFSRSRDSSSPTGNWFNAQLLWLSSFRDNTRVWVRVHLSGGICTVPKRFNVFFFVPSASLYWGFKWNQMFWERTSLKMMSCSSRLWNIDLLGRTAVWWFKWWINLDTREISWRFGESGCYCCLFLMVFKTLWTVASAVLSCWVKMSQLNCDKFF